MKKEMNLRAAAYCMYMMVGSFFHHTRCVTPILEENCHLYYKEMRTDDQYALEEKCGKYLVSKVFDDPDCEETAVEAAKFPAEYQEEPVEMSFHFYDNANAEIRVRNEHFLLRFMIRKEKDKGLRFKVIRMDRKQPAGKAKKPAKTAEKKQNLRKAA